MFLAKVKKVDWFILAAVILLGALGMVIIYSTTLDSGETFTRFHKQALSFVIGMSAFVVLAIIDYRTFRSMAAPLFVVLALLLIAVLIFGIEVRGAKSWFDLGFYRLQPSEIGKFIMVVALAKYFSDHMKDRRRLKMVAVSAVYTLLPAALILVEPDLGTAMVYGGLWLSMLFATGTRARNYALIAVVAIVAAVFAWSFLLADYQKDRLISFVDPTYDPLDQGYNITQSQIAIGSGGLLGKGLGHGSQSQLKFLPEQQTDFIFAATAEELGLAGSAFLILLFGFLIVRTIWVAKISRDDFGMFIAIGVAAILLIQTLVNIGMNLGLMPVTGIPLPLVSYGGSSVLVTLALLGLVESVYIRHRMIDFR
ncbi:rod shape-determining protein RodA [Patescibacteria group bacterium]